jgi:DNA-binding NtrC family response regulator
VLVVDDEPAARSALTELLRDEGYEAHSAADGYKALGRVDQWLPDVVITDVKMPALGGIELMAKLRERQPEISVVIMTAFGSVEGAVEAMQLGADDYLSKPIELQHLLLLLERVVTRRELAKEAMLLRSALTVSDAEVDGAIIGESKAFRYVLDLAGQVAATPVPVLLAGPSGCGKQLLARSIHRSSERPGPFVALRCGAFGEAALERELFGFRSDGAGQDGRLHEADRGTLLLIDVEELSPNLQARLLGFMQDRTFMRIGDGARIASDVRLLATTTRNLEAEAKAGRFRSDLFYRLAAVTIRVPSLRERREDLPLLATHFVKRYARQVGKRISGCSERTLGMLENFDWPGNILQLEHCLERAVIVARNAELEPRDLPKELMEKSQSAQNAPVVPGASLWEIERHAILQTLEHVGGSTSKAAKILGISARKIQYRLNEYEQEDKPPPSNQA